MHNFGGVNHIPFFFFSFSFFFFFFLLFSSFLFFSFLAVFETLEPELPGGEASFI